MNFQNSRAMRPTFRSSLIVAALGMTITTGFRCPGPDPAGGQGGDGGGGAGSGGDPSTTSQGGAGGGGCSADLDNDPLNCGACGRACDALNTEFPTCSFGQCDSPCLFGWANVSMPAAPTPDDGCEAAVHRVFVTSGPVDASFGQTAGALDADALCDSYGEITGSPFGWQAWTSDSSVSPSVRFNSPDGPYVLMDGTLVAKSWVDLTDGFIEHAIDQDEVGGTGYDVDVWTGTAPNGTLSLLQDSSGFVVTNCVDWTDAQSDSDFAAVGHTTNTDAGWTELPDPQYCFEQNIHLYCFEQ